MSTVALDLPALDRLVEELLRSSGALGEHAVGLYQDLGATGVSTDPARRVGAVATWCYDQAQVVRRRVEAARAAEALALSAADPPSVPSGGGGGFGGWLSDRVDDVGDVAGDLRDGAEGLAGEVVDRGSEVLDAAGGWTADRWADAAAALDGAADDVVGAFDDAVHWVGGALDDAGGWVDEHLSGVRDWIGDHADVLRLVGDLLSETGKALVAVGATLAALSAAAGFFSFGIGWLGELPAGAILTVGFLLWSAGEGVDTAVDWGEGEVDGQGLLTGVVVEVVGSLGLGRLLTHAGRLLEPLLPRLRRWVDDLASRGDGDSPALPDPGDTPPLPGPPAPREWPTDPQPGTPEYDLGFDPAINKFRRGEYETSIRIMEERGVS
jgi:hypothetical protein